MSDNYKQKLKNISTFVFDVDGVFTDGSVTLVPPDGMVRTMNTKDGYAVQYAIKQGFEICIITGGTSEMVKTRMNLLGVEHVFLKSSNKRAVLNTFIENHNLNSEELLYMGDDIPDYESMQLCGIKTCPKDAVEEIKAICDYVSPVLGGKGCVRDVIEQTMKVQGKWFDEKAHQW